MQAVYAVAMAVICSVTYGAERRRRSKPNRLLVSGNSANASNNAKNATFSNVDSIVVVYDTTMAVTMRLKVH